jgi:major intracellular serine protease
MLKAIVALSLFIPITLAAKPITVLSIDTGVSLTHSSISSHVKEPFNENYQDNHGHGTHIAGLILKDTCKEVEFISCKYYDRDSDSEEDRIALSLYCFQKARLLKVDFLNYSSSGRNYYQPEYNLIKAIIANGTKVIVAAGNDSLNLSVWKRYPAAYKIPGLIVVGNLTPSGYTNLTSNYGLNGMQWEMGSDIRSTLPNGQFGVMSGTSQATAIKTNKLIKRRCNEK